MLMCLFSLPIAPTFRLRLSSQPLFRTLGVCTLGGFGEQPWPGSCPSTSETVAFSLNKSVAGVGPALLLVFRVVFPLSATEVLSDMMEQTWYVLFLTSLKNNPLWKILVK